MCNRKMTKNKITIWVKKKKKKKDFVTRRVESDNRGFEVAAMGMLVHRNCAFNLFN